MNNHITILSFVVVLWMLYLLRSEVKRALIIILAWITTIFIIILHFIFILVIIPIAIILGAVVGVIDFIRYKCCKKVYNDPQLEPFENGNPEPEWLKNLYKKD